MNYCRASGGGALSFLLKKESNRSRCKVFYCEHSSPKIKYFPLLDYLYNKKVAFTLAEVLVTLGVLGVVAALTMPGMIINHRKKIVAESVKKTYSELNQVLKMAEIEHGMISDWRYRKVDELDKWVQTYFEPYVKVINSGKCQVGSKCFGFSGIHCLGYDVSLNNANAQVPHYMVVTGGVPLAYGFFAMMLLQRGFVYM